MGIPGFNTWVRKQYPDAFVKLSPSEPVDHLYVDLACTLHVIIRKSTTEYQFHRRLHKRLDEYLEAFRPRKRLAVGGVWGRLLGLPQLTSAATTRLGLDVCLLAALASGNDYLPALQGISISGTEGRPGLWALHLDQYGSSVGQDCDQHLTEESGCPDRPLRIHRRRLAALLWRYYEQGRRLAAGETVSRTGVWMLGPEPQPIPPEPHLLDRRPPYDERRRGSPDIERYVEGLEWLVNMYYTGRVADYRFRYDVAAPTLLALVGGLAWGTPGARGASWSDESAPEGQANAKELDRNDTTSLVSGPLIPAACAVATLPMAARRHAARAVRHLMTDGDDSPLAHIFATCPTCVALCQNLQVANQRLREVRAQAAMPVDAYLEANSLEQEALAALAAAGRDFDQHVHDAHPYAPFPIGEIEAAVAAIPVGSYPAEERALAAFGKPLTLRYSREAAARDSRVTGVPSWWDPVSVFLKKEQPRLGRERITTRPPGGVVCEALGRGVLRRRPRTTRRVCASQLAGASVSLPRRPCIFSASMALRSHSALLRCFV
ncbi:hypothetical protein QBZ16_002345 [Prototheca wickerhamii]|uniref:Xrn1 N-terminal domain-containing protein n=1 Tax=Prototheca wickerhamii TaxID=3111 RepID=A0AAD9MLM4_PROWI|nr:hypothetical protein QBZ16_002345 [Prototheca wickerhamii]